MMMYARGCCPTLLLVPHGMHVDVVGGIKVVGDLHQSPHVLFVAMIFRHTRDPGKGIDQGGVTPV